MSSPANIKASKSRWRFVLYLLIGISVLVFNPLSIRAFFYQPFNIPAASMSPTLLVGDYLFVSKFSYGYSKHSFPWRADNLNGRIWGAAPERGDVAVFKLPRDDSIDYIKRIVGLPGDRVQLRDGILHLNGEAVKRSRTEDFPLTDFDGSIRNIPRYVETMPNGVSYEVLDLMEGSAGDDTQEFVVPAGHYFMLGDNRDNSSDSRWGDNYGVGFVPEENLVGRAEIIFYSKSGWERAFIPVR